MPCKTKSCSIFSQETTTLPRICWFPNNNSSCSKFRLHPNFREPAFTQVEVSETKLILEAPPPNLKDWILERPLSQQMTSWIPPTLLKPMEMTFFSFLSNSWTRHASWVRSSNFCSTTTHPFLATTAEPPLKPRYQSEQRTKVLYQLVHLAIESLYIKTKWRPQDAGNGVP